MIKSIKNEKRLKLVLPTEEYKEQVMEYRSIFLENNESFDGCSGLEECETYEKWVDFENRLSKKYKESYSKTTVFLVIRISDNKLVGIIDFRHKLTDFLFNYGGNIGYSILPSERKKGYASEALSLVLEYCSQIGIHKVLLTCDKINIASEKVILSNGGILENEIEDNVGISKSGIIKRYWIYLKKKFADFIYYDDNLKEVKQSMKKCDDKDFKGYVYLDYFIEVGEPYYIPNGLCIRNNGYKWLEFYDFDSNLRLSALYDEKEEIVEWYFDVSRKIGLENDIAYQDDLYLDVVLRPNGEIILLDEEELKDALERNEISKEEFEWSYKIAEDLMERLKGKTEKVKEFTDGYLKELSEML